MSKVKKRVETWKDLEVWQCAHRLVLKIYEITRQFPSEERFRLTDQLCRASISIPMNIAEGKGRSSLKEYLQFLAIARGSAEEVKYQLLLARDLEYLEVDTYTETSKGYDQVGKMLNGLIRSLKSRART